MSGSKEQATSMAMSQTMNSALVAPAESSGDHPQMHFLQEYKALSFMAIRPRLAYWPS